MRYDENNDPSHSQAPKQEVEMFALDIPVAAIARLTADERFSYYLLGHMFNELMCLQKLIGFSLPKHDDLRPARLLPELSQAMFLFRLSSAKVWEAIQTFKKSRPLAQTLRSKILALMPDGPAKLKALYVEVERAGWLAPMRNGIGFHFPTVDAWKTHIEPDETWSDEPIFMGQASGNTFYSGADALAQTWMLEQYGAPSLTDAVQPLIQEMIGLLRNVNAFLEQAISVLVAEVMLDTVPPLRGAGTLMAPEFSAVSIPLWTRMPRPNES